MDSSERSVESPRNRRLIPLPEGAVENCLTGGIPPLMGNFNPGIGPFAAPRIIRAMDQRGLIIR